MKQLFFIMVLFLCCACEKEDPIIESGPLQALNVTPGRLYNVNVSVTDNRLIISCLGENITLQEVYVVGNGGFSASASFTGPSARVKIPGYGYYLINVKYLDLGTTSIENYNVGYDYRASGGQEVPPVLPKCNHDFSNFSKNATRSIFNENINITVCFTGHFKAVFYPVYVLPGYHPDDYVRIYNLNWNSSPIYETLTLDKSPYASYELRIYSSDCTLPYQQCTHYLKVGIEGQSNITDEPVWLDEHKK